MSNKDSSDEQNETYSLEFSLQLELIASFLGAISDALGILALLEVIEESKIAKEQEVQEQKELDERLKNMQDQIDQLTDELTIVKSSGK